MDNSLELRLDNFIATLRPALDAYRIKKKAIDLAEAPEFNIFRYISRSENQLTQIIGHLLDPDETHGQGDRFLKSFLDLLPDRIKNTPEFSTKFARIQFEHKTVGIQRDRRRIDLLIDFGNAGIGIECKPYPDLHGELPRQLEDYRDHLMAKYRQHFVLVFLSSDGRLPTSLSIADRQRLTSAGRLQTLSFRSDIAKWLETCVGQTQAPSVMWYLTQLLSDMRRRFPESGDQNEGSPA